MCGDIMNIWNAKSVRNTLNHLIGIVRAVQMGADEKQEDYRLKSTNNQTSIKKHYSVGTSHLQEQRLRNDIEASQRPRRWLLNGLGHTKNETHNMLSVTNSYKKNEKIGLNQKQELRIELQQLNTKRHLKADGSQRHTSIDYAIISQAKLTSNSGNKNLLSVRAGV